VVETWVLGYVKRGDKVYCINKSATQTKNQVTSHGKIKSKYIQNIFIYK